MIYGIIHKGSGLGNQLHRYVATRVLAADKGYEFGMVAPENFKGAGFMQLNMGLPFPSGYTTLSPSGEVVPGGEGKWSRFAEKKVTENGVDIRGYDPEINFVEDNTIIDGEFQDERYFEHRLPEIDEWLTTKPLTMPNDYCVIGFRGGEFQYIPELFLPRSYYEAAMAQMRAINPRMKFVAVTDDPVLARNYLPQDVKITHDIAEDWRKIRYARYLIISNSSFYILPSLLNRHAELVIAPRFWARRNTGGPWALPQNSYKNFTYI